MPFLYYYTHVNRPHSEAQASLAALRAQLPQWLGVAHREFCELATGARPQGEETAKFLVDSLKTEESDTHLSLGWRTSLSDPVPSLDGELMLRPLDVTSCQLALQATYDTPDGILDWSRVHRAGETAVKHLVDTIGESLESS